MINIRHFVAFLLVIFAIEGYACTSAIVSGKLTANGRPLLWKNRDTDDQNNRVKKIPAHDGNYEFVGLFDAGDRKDSAVWMGYNEKGFAIMNTASYNLKDDDVKDMDKEGVVMKLALEKCASVDEFEDFLKKMPKPMRVEANFGVIDAMGNGAYFETCNYAYKKFDVNDSESGILTRTNYSYSGRVDEGFGYIREQSEKTLIAPHIVRHDFTPAVFTEGVCKTFYHSLLGQDFTYSGTKWLVEQDFIARSISTASTVIEGVLPGENPLLTTMWIALGYPPCAEVSPVWLWENGVPVELQGTGENNHAPQCDIVNAREDSVFSVKRGNGPRYFDLSKLYNAQNTGYCQVLIPKNMETYKTGYEILAQRRLQFSKTSKKSKLKKEKTKR